MWHASHHAAPCLRAHNITDSDLILIRSCTVPEKGQLHRITVTTDKWFVDRKSVTLQWSNCVKVKLATTLSNGSLAVCETRPDKSLITGRTAPDQLFRIARVTHAACIHKCSFIPRILAVANRAPTGFVGKPPTYRCSYKNTFGLEGCWMPLVDTWLCTVGPRF